MRILLPSTALKMQLLLRVMYRIGLHKCTVESLGAIQWDPRLQRLRVCLKMHVLLRTVSVCTVPRAEQEEC